MATRGEINRQQFRIELRTLLLFIACAAAGCTLLGGRAELDAADPLWASVLALAVVRGPAALMTAGSAALVIGLFQEALGIQRQDKSIRAARPDATFALRAAWVWRIACAIGLVFCAAFNAAIARGRFQPPKSDWFLLTDVVTGYLWWFLILVVLTSLGGVSRNVPRRQIAKVPFDVVIYAGGALIAFYLLRNLSFIVYLVHLGCRGVDMTNPLRDQRYEVDTVAEGIAFASYAIAAVAMIVCGLLLQILALQRDWRRPFIQVAIIALGSLLIAGAAWYCFWYFKTGLPAASPDLAAAKPTANWWLGLGDVVLAMALVTVGAFRLSAREVANCEPVRVAIGATLLSHSAIIAITFAVAAILAIAGQIWAALDPTAFASVMEMLGYVATDPTFILTSAIALTSLRILWKSWKRPNLSKTLALRPIDRAYFAAIWAVLAIFTAIFIPTLAAASLAVWFVPWYAL